MSNLTNKCMNYVIIDAEIKEAGGARIRNRGASKYLRLTCENPYDKFERAAIVPIFAEGAVKKWEQWLPKEKGGVKPNEEYGDMQWLTKMRKDKSLQRELILTNCSYVQYDLGGEYVREYTEDIVDAEGNAIKGKKKGDIICGKNGLPKIVRTIMVLCRSAYKMEDVFDETTWERKLRDDGTPMMKPVRDKNGNLIEEWVAEWTPEERGESMKSLLIPYEQAKKKIKKHMLADIFTDDDIEDPEDEDEDDDDIEDIDDEDEDEDDEDDSDEDDDSDDEDEDEDDSDDEDEEEEEAPTPKPKKKH